MYKTLRETAPSAVKLFFFGERGNFSLIYEKTSGMKPMFLRSVEEENPITFEFSYICLVDRKTLLAE